MKATNRTIRYIRSKQRARKLIKRGENVEMAGRPEFKHFWRWYVPIEGMRNPK